MTSAQFREIALSFPEAVEAAHMGHPDFRVGGKIFATLGYQNEGCGVLLLSPEEQQEVGAFAGQQVTNGAQAERSPATSVATWLP